MHAIRIVSPDSVAVMRAVSSPYVFSSVNTRKPNRYPPNATDGSGKSKLNFMYERPRGGIKISLVDVSSMMSPGLCVTPDTSATAGNGSASSPSRGAPPVS